MKYESLIINRIAMIILSFDNDDHHSIDSTNMFKLATALPWAFPKSQILLQDFMLPRDRAGAFLDKLQSNLRLWPIWFLPMRNIKQSNSVFAGADIEGHFCNIGAYGIPRNRYDFVGDNKRLEEFLWTHQGRKVYYR